MRQEDVSIGKRQEDREKNSQRQGGKEGQNSAEQRFAPGGESRPPASLPLPGSLGSTEPDCAGAKTNLKRFLCLLLAFLDILFSLGLGGVREPWQDFGGNE